MKDSSSRESGMVQKIIKNVAFYLSERFIGSEEEHWLDAERRVNEHLKAKNLVSRFSGEGIPSGIYRGDCLQGEELVIFESVLSGIYNRGYRR